jgi:ATP/maltotriose-dependent transcriptional regulator MalT
MVASNRPPGREVRDLQVIATTSRLAGPDTRVVTFSSSASADAGVSLEGDLLATRIDDATAYDICLVCSPPGFGKTTALAAWAAGNARPIAWLTLDEDDDDLTLVLDDYHVIASPQIQGGVAFLLGHLPCGLRRVIAGRSDPPLPLGELRARGRLAEVRAADLRFSTEETASFLRDLWGLQLPDDAIAALTERTEGWVAGLQPAALSLRHQPDPSAFVAAFAGSHRFVLDYLSEEVVARRPEEMRRLLLTTSILERLSGPLCDALTGHSDGQERLEHAERANLFVVPLDEKRRWYRFHHLLTDVLRRFVSSAQRGYRPTSTEEVVGYSRDWRSAGGDARHGQEASDPHLRKARGGEPDGGRGPRP